MEVTEKAYDKNTNATTLRHTHTHLIEAPDHGFSLLHHAPLHPPAHHPLDVLLLVLLRHVDVGPARLQLPLRHLIPRRDNRETTPI